MHSLEKKLLASWPPEQWGDVTILVAVSGGADSIALLRALLAQRIPSEGRVIVAHFNHRLRGADSDQDAEFVKGLCQSLGVEARLGEAEPNFTESSHSDGLESAAREARYAFLQTEAHRVGARYLVTAHTADDQAETILHRILRGTGIAGLAGIPRTRPMSEVVTIIRPLLAVRRTEIISYLQSLGQDFCEDQSNQDLKFTRNRIRHQLLPLLASEYNPLVVETLLRLGTLAGETQLAVDTVVAKLWPQAVRICHPHFVEVDCKAFSGYSEHAVREFFIALWKRQHWPLREMSFEHWGSLAALATTPETSPGNLIANSMTISLPDGIAVKRAGAILSLNAPSHATPN